MLRRLQRFLRSGIPPARIKPLSRSHLPRPFVVTLPAPSAPAVGRRTRSLAAVIPLPTAVTAPGAQAAGPTPEAVKLPTPTPRMMKLERRIDVIDDLPAPRPAPDPPGVTPPARRESNILPAAPPVRPKVITQPAPIPPAKHSEKANERLDAPVDNTKREHLTHSEVVARPGSTPLVASPGSIPKLRPEAVPGSRTPPPAQITDRGATALPPVTLVMTEFDEDTRAEIPPPRSTPPQPLSARRHSAAPVAATTRTQTPHRALPMADALRPLSTAPDARAPLSPHVAQVGEPPKPAVSVHIGRVEVKSAAGSETASQLPRPPRHHSIALRGWHEGP